MSEKPSMSMNTIIHAAVRRDFARLEDALGRPDAIESRRADDLGRAFDHLHDQLHHHHTQEEKYVLPTLSALGVSADVGGWVTSEHEDMVAALDLAETAMAEYRGDPNDRTLNAARSAVGHAAQVTDTHLVHEEAEVEPIVAGLHDTAEWKAAEKQLRKMSPSVTGHFMAWLNDGLDPTAKAALDQEVPRPVQALFITLFGRRYRREVASIWA